MRYWLILAFVAGLLARPLVLLLWDAWEERHDEQLNILSKERREMMIREDITGGGL